MICADTNTWIAYLQGDSGFDVEILDRALADRGVVMAPPVLTELLSDPKLTTGAAKLLAGIPMVELDEGFWRRAGTLRAKVLAKGRKARLGDALIAQTCLDHGVPLVTRDKDFQVFIESAGLQVLIA